MSYKIEITASTTAELAGKLLALAATMHTTPADPVMPEVREAAAPKPAKARKAKAEEAVEEQETSVGEPVTAAEETASSPSDTATAQPELTESSETEKNTVVSSENSASVEAAPLDFDKDVAPVVLSAVEKLGKPWVQGVLGQFGVERASQIEDGLMAEFVAALKDGMA